ncbi:MAG: hypothetical protein JST55_08455 [Bacteroidetes bacterium]|nr:hypothetical protein [Bacteroidota bacterium]
MLTKHIWLRLSYTAAGAYVFIVTLPPKVSVSYIIFVPVTIILLSIIHASFLVIQYHTSTDPKSTFYEFYLEKYSNTFRFLKSFPADFIFRFTFVNLFYFLAFRYVVTLINFITTPPP